MRKNRTVPLMLALALCMPTLACKKPAAPPSQEYAKARSIWLDLLREKRDKAYLAPEVDEVISLLQAVDPKSLDATSAQGLLEEIVKGKTEARSAQASLEEQVELAKRAGQAKPSDVVFRNLPVDAGSGAAGAASDAGVTVPTLGMSQSDFLSQFGSCFEFRTQAAVAGQFGGQVYGLKDLLGCRQDFRAFVDSSVVLFDGRVAAIKSNSDLTPSAKFKVVDGKLVPATEEDLKPKPAPTPPAPEPQAPPPPPGDVTPRPANNPLDVTPKAGPNPNDVTPQ